MKKKRPIMRKQFLKLKKTPFEKTLIVFVVKKTEIQKENRNDVKRFLKSMYKTHLPDQHRSYPYIVIKSLKNAIFS